MNQHVDTIRVLALEIGVLESLVDNLERNRKYDKRYNILSVGSQKLYDSVTAELESKRQEARELLRSLWVVQS